MSELRLRRRVAGFLGKRLAELHLDDVPDARDPRGQRWQLKTLLRATVVGLAAGAKGLGEVEDITEQMTPAMKRWIQISRRVPDTTLRDALVTVKPEHVPPVLHQAVRAAHRRKALTVDGLPIGVLSLDGKVIMVPASDDWYAQRQSQQDNSVRGAYRHGRLDQLECPTLYRCDADSFTHQRDGDVRDSVRARGASLRWAGPVSAGHL